MEGLQIQNFDTNIKDLKFVQDLTQLDPSASPEPEEEDEEEEQTKGVLENI